jgi:peptidoglycan/LPS O-acetylase OafA/YrhL
MDVTEKSYYPYFDYLRIILAVVVMLYHDNIIGWHHSGSLAVDVFFALSGWLIGSILLKTAKEELPRFYFNRAIRIWIPYYIGLIFIVCASLLKDPINAQWFEFISYKLTWVYNLFGPPQLAEFSQMMPLDGTGNHFWSVNAEEQFYLLAPLILVLLGTTGKKVTTWVLIAAALYFLDVYASISFGVLAAVFKHEYGDYHQNRYCKFICLSTLLAAGTALYYNYNYVTFAPFLAISTVLLLAVKGKKSKVGVFLGGMSYPLYLNHWIGVFFFNLVLEPFDLRNTPLRQFLSVLMNLGIAAFLFYYIERICLSYRHKLFNETRGKIITIIAYMFVILGISIGYILHPTTTHLYILLSALVISTIALMSILLKTTKTQTIISS